MVNLRKFVLFQRILTLLPSANHRITKDTKNISTSPRIIFVNSPEQSTPSVSKDFVTNKISTAKYTPFTFFFKFLYEQFSKYANLFFLFTSVLQQIPNISPTNRFTTILPLTLVLLISAVKELIEDSQRRSCDRVLNNLPTKVFSITSTPPTFISSTWKEVRVGDILRVESEQALPADLILLSSSEPDGLCYIETCNLDGETNLKIRQALGETSNLLSTEDLSKFSAVIRSEQPNCSLYTFEATLKVKCTSGQDVEVSLSPDQLLLRGATLRNTPWVYGVVVFTGHETKLLRNATTTPIKKTTIARMVNVQILILGAILVILSVISSVGDIILRSTSWRELAYLNYRESSAVRQFFVDLLTYWVLYSNLVPLSLFVTLELVQYAVAFLISSDLDIYYSPTDTPVNCRTSSLVEELGQVEYIFSDKTGTLTCNKMEFRQCSIGGVQYGGELRDTDDEAVVDSFEDTTYVSKEVSSPSLESQKGSEGRRLHGGGEGGKIYDFSRLSSNRREKRTGWQLIHHFLCVLSICHTVIPERACKGGEEGLSRYVNEEVQGVSKGEKHGGRYVDTMSGEKDHSNEQGIKYQAASPDEGALVKGAAELGYRFVARKPHILSLEIDGICQEYELLAICEFNSTRKRMSGLFRCPDGKIRLYCKGADSVIFERLKGNGKGSEDSGGSGGGGGGDDDDDIVSTTLVHLEEYAAEGLRTLCIAYREISEEEFREWWVKFNEAQLSVSGNRGKLLDEAAELIEKNLILLGATAIEDKLQDEVPETIQTLQNAGIKIWVLTGDRQETAINIGMSCRLLSEEMNLIIINENTHEHVSMSIRRNLENVRNHGSNFTRPGGTGREKFALIIDGKSLEFALTKDIEKDLFDLTLLCCSVVCCRVSPLQKALVVKLAKKFTKSVLLAIGDGANDVSMIQAAHIGIGITGVEGMQAARNSDISLAQFKFLRKLLLVHGAWSCHRISHVILYSYYKNVTLFMTQFWYSFQNAFSGEVIYESWTLSFYNVLFTMLPPFVIGIFDQFVGARLLDRYPQLYALSRKRIFFRMHSFVAWIANGFYHSLILYIGSQLIWLWDAPLRSGIVAGHWVWGTALYTTALVTVLGKAALTTNVWNKWTVAAIPGSFVIWAIFLPTFAILAPMLHFAPEYTGVLPVLITAPQFALMVIILPMICLIRDFAWKYFKRMYHPLAYHHIQEIQKYNVPDYRPRMEQFQKAIFKVGQKPLKHRYQRGYAFSQTDESHARVLLAYDTTRFRGRFGEMASSLGREGSFYRGGH